MRIRSRARKKTTWAIHSVSLLPGLPVCCAEAVGSPEKNSQWSLFHKMKLFASQLPLGPPRCYQLFSFCHKAPQAHLSICSANPTGRLLPWTEFHCLLPWSRKLFMLARDGVEIPLCAFEVLPPGLSNLLLTLNRDGVWNRTVCV